MAETKSRLPRVHRRTCLAAAVCFIAVTCFFAPYLALAEAAVTTVLLLLARRGEKLRRETVREYVETLAREPDREGRVSLRTAPVGMMVFRPDTLECMWGNERFREITGAQDDLFERRMSELLPDFSAAWLIEGHTECPETVQVGEKHFRVYGSLSRPNAAHHGAAPLLATTYWLDVTETDALRKDLAEHAPIVGIIMIDNYDELMKAGTEASRSAVLAQIDEKLNDWVKDTHSLLRKYDRNRYLFVLTDACYQPLADGKFSILDSVRSVVTEDGVAATLSIGIGRDAEDFETLFRYATLSIEMALSRGGDQVVVRNKLDFAFYGGKSKSTEKHTKVKSRVMANALGELITDARQIFVMGHKNADMDTIGAAVGICCIARKRGRRAQIVLDEDTALAPELLAQIRALPEYHDTFISGNDAFIKAQAGALLVVVDTNRPEIVESEQLLDACNRVAVIDHHRRAASYIESAALNFHEPYASSASELVSELMQYLTEPGDVLRAEAEALLAGIVLDTKNFQMRTGSRTFEAAAYLRRAGADPTEVQRLFQSGFDEMVSRCNVLRRAEMLSDGIALAAIDEECDRVNAAKAADELLSLTGVRASFVVFRCDGGINVSARSLGEVNVQVVMEQLGGGGNSTVAGGRIPDGTVDAVREQLIAAIRETAKE